MPDTTWACLTCPERGTTTGTESGADVKHVKATGHATTTGPAADAIAARADHGPCTHRPPSPGQSLCSCGHQRIEMEYAARIAEAGAARVAGGEAP